MSARDIKNININNSKHKNYLSFEDNIITHNLLLSKGLDATSSFELLHHLNKLALSNRTVILTIHQPRLEIFHMFNRLALLAGGKVGFHAGLYNYDTMNDPTVVL